MTVLFTEEPSMEVVLRDLIGRHFPAAIEFADWMIVSHSGKSDLEKQFPDRMRRWGWGNPLFVILRDNDGGDCKGLKHHLASLAAVGGHPFKVRIVCQELEGWLIGDSAAVTAAYPRCRFSNSTAKYRDPDRLTNAAEELAKLTGDLTKRVRASRIAAHLDPSRNVSRSFQVFFQTLQQHLG
jgi:Domain of unknown function (DUF4276)